MAVSELCYLTFVSTFCIYLYPEVVGKQAYMVLQ